jgi:N-acetylglucosamine transport system permease protein
MDKRRKKKGQRSVIGTLILCVAAAVVILPLIWVFLTSLKSNQDFYVNVWGLPKEWMWGNYVRAWVKGNIGTAAINSIFVTVGSLLVCLLCSTTTAYALSRFSFRLGRSLRKIYIAAIMVPSIIVLIPQYFMLINLKLIDSLFGLILVYGLSSVPFTTFVLYGFFQTLPHEIEEAAMIDGAGYIRTFRQIMLPLAQPGVITVMVINFIDYWNEYYKAITYISSSEKMTLPVGLVIFSQQSQYRVDWGGLMASNILMIVPAIVVYCIFQKTIQKGLTAGAVKG